MQQGELFSNAFVCHNNLATRLREGFKEAWSEFKQDPSKFVQDLVRRDKIAGRRRAGMRLGLAVALVFYSICAFSLLVFWSGAKHELTPPSEYTIIPKLFDPGPSQKIEAPNSDSDKDESGGGGGGRNQIRPASEGQLPRLALTQPLIAPTTKPQLTPPELALALTLQVDPRLQRPRDDSAIGLPNGVPGPPSDGPGLIGGIGTGDLGGIGDGKGKGLGPGQGFNTGGGPPRIGGREVAVAFDTAPSPLNRPRPNYTEEARKNKVQGLVRARVLVGADGLVKQVAIRQGLPDGLDEEAIRAAYSMRFTPARKSGNAVAVWVALEIEFNLR